MPEKKTKSMYYFLIKLENPHFGPTSGPFHSRNVNSRFFAKNSLISISSPYADATLCKNSKMF